MNDLLREFKMGNQTWRITVTSNTDARLVDQTGVFRLATTDPKTNCIYLSEKLSGDLLHYVLIHELAHCVMISYGYSDFIRKVVKQRYWVESEEWVCNTIARHSKEVLGIADDILGG